MIYLVGLGFSFLIVAIFCIGLWVSDLDDKIKDLEKRLNIIEEKEEKAWLYCNFAK